MTPKKEKASTRVLARLLGELIRDRFKRLAKDEVLSKFLASRMDPALLVDHYLQAERKALELAELSLLELVSPDRLTAELNSASQWIQSNLKEIYGEAGESFTKDEVLFRRAEWMRSRIEFYSRWLSIQSTTTKPWELAVEAFKNSKSFSNKLERLFRADENMDQALVAATPSFYRLLMKRQLEHELQSAREVWNQFMSEAFKETKVFPE